MILGIDYGGKYTGLAVVDRRNNAVLYTNVVKMLDIADTLKGRRAQRSLRRCSQSKKKRLRDVKSGLIEMGFGEGSDVFKEVYRLAHKRGWDYAPLEEMPPEELEAMDKKEREKLEKKWEETKALSRHRDEVLPDVRRVMSDGGASEEHINQVVDIFNRPYRQKRFHNRILTKCKVCGKNTPKRKNVRELLLDNIIRFMQIDDADKSKLKGAVIAVEKDKTTELFKELRKKYKMTLNQTDWPGKNLMDIATNKLPGRIPFCKEHFAENEKYTTIEKSTFRLAPSLKTKIANVVGIIEKDILPKFTLSGVVMESNNFDIAAKTKGKKRLAKEDYAKGERKGKTLKESLHEETGGRCIYCGRDIQLSEVQEDHIFPKKAGGLNIYANLVACCSTCNNKKGGRTPQESGVIPNRKIFKTFTNDLKIKILEDANAVKELDFNKFMSHASIGWRHMRDELKRITGNNDLTVYRQSGIITAHFRKWWGFKKERENHYHHALDAVILASRKDSTEDGRVDMTLKPRAENGGEFNPEKHVPALKTIPKKNDNRGARLHDTEPLSYKNGRITKKVPVTSIEPGKEEFIVSTAFGEKLRQAFEARLRKAQEKIDNAKKDPNTSAKQIDDLEKAFKRVQKYPLSDTEAQEYGFYLEKGDGRKRGKVMSLKYEMTGMGPKVLVKINNNYFRTNVHNVAVEVYLDENGKKKSRLKKNPRLLKHLVEKPAMEAGKVLFVLRRGDIVAVDGEDMPYRITQLGTSPKIVPVTGGEPMRPSATRLTKIKGNQ